MATSSWTGFQNAVSFFILARGNLSG